MSSSAPTIEQDIEFSLQASADYIILDGRGDGTAAAPLLFRNHLSARPFSHLSGHVTIWTNADTVSG